MVLSYLCKIVFLAVMMFPGWLQQYVLPQGAPSAALVAGGRGGSATQPAESQSETLAAQQYQNLPPGSGSILTALGRTKFAQLFSGKKPLTPGEMVQMHYWLDAIKDLLMAVMGFIPRLLIGLFFLIFFWLFYRGVRRVVLGSMTRAHVDSSIRDMLGAVLKWCIMGFGLVIAGNQVGIQITALLTGVSIIGLAIGFAAQETLANFIAGIVIFWDKPFKVGDWLDVGNKYGRVLRITFRSTRLLSLDGEVVILPNTSVLAQQVTNHSTNPLQRINVNVGVTYRGSTDLARGVLLSTTDGDARILRDPPATVIVATCSDMGVTLTLRFWIRDESVEKAIEDEYREKAKRAFDAAGIVAPLTPPVPTPVVAPEAPPATRRTAA